MASRTANIASVPDLGYGSGGIVDLQEPAIRENLQLYIHELSSGRADTPERRGILGFFELMRNAIRSREISQKVEEEHRLLIQSSDPPQTINTEAITFELASRTPGTLSRGKMGNGRVRELSHHVRSVTEHPEHLGEKLVTMGKLFDNYIILNLYARDNDTALKRIVWVENVMDSFRWYFRLFGVPEVVETEVEGKKVVTVGDLELVKYSMTYFVKTEDTYTYGEQKLRKIDIKTTVSTG